MATDLLEVPGVTQLQARRHLSALVALVVGLLLGTLVTFAFTRSGGPEPSAPIFSSEDGLPTALSPGGHYTARLTVGVPDDWSYLNEFNEQLPVLVAATVNTTEDASTARILCTGTVSPGDIVTLACPLTAPTRPGTQLTIAFGVGTRTSTGVPQPSPTSIEQTYVHTVTLPDS